MPARMPMVETVLWQGVPALQLQDASGASAVCALHGGHVLSWRSADGIERLFLSTRTRIGEGHAVRGGVPVIFPRFAQREGFVASVPRHGFARTRAWHAGGDAPGSSGGDWTGAVDTFDEAEGAAVARLRLTDDEATRALWPHRFELGLTVRLHGPQLTLGLEVHNTDDTAWDFQAALHTYLAVAQVDGARLDGLAQVGYVDSTRGQSCEPSGEALRFDAAEIDRIYPAAASRRTNVGGDDAQAWPACLLDDGQRCLKIEAIGLPDVVVWNPGVEKATKIDDLGPGEDRSFVCVEAAAIEPMGRLQPGQRWRGLQRLTALA